MSLQQDGMVTLLDVRSMERSNLFPSGRSKPLEEMEKPLSELPKEREIVAYCNGPRRVLSFEAVAALRMNAFRGGQFEDSFPG